MRGIYWTRELYVGQGTRQGLRYDFLEKEESVNWIRLPNKNRVKGGKTKKRARGS